MTIEAYFGCILEQSPAVIRTEVVGTSAQEPGLAQVAEQQQYVLPPENFNTPVRRTCRYALIKIKQVGTLF